jgi:APA family basic amino acid/polyamine antiporter
MPATKAHHPADSSAVRQSPAEMTRRLGLGSAAAAVAGEAIAVGIFLTPAGMARSLGSPFWLLAVWLAMGIMALCGAFCYGELTARFPAAGGGYVYLREAYGPRIAFLYGWKCFLVLDPGITAALAVGLAAYVSYLTPLSSAAMKFVAIAVIVIVAALNMRQASLGAGLLRWITWLKLGILAALPLWAFGRGAGDWSNFSPFVAQRPGAEPLPAALAAGFVAAFFTFGGWWDAAKIGGEVKDPERTLPRAMILGVLAVTAVYILMSVMFIYVVPMGSAGSDETFVAQAGERVFGPAGGQILSLIVILCVLGSVAAVIMTAPRVYYAMARDGVFFHGVAQLHPRFGTPARAIALQAAVATLLVVLGTFGQIIAYFIFVAVLFIGLTIGSLFVIRRRPGDRPPPLARGYPYAPAIFLGLVLVLLVLLAFRNPMQAFLGTGVVALGIPAFALFRTRPGSPSSPRPLRPHA